MGSGVLVTCAECSTSTKFRLGWWQQPLDVASRWLADLASERHELYTGHKTFFLNDSPEEMAGQIEEQPDLPGSHQKPIGETPINPTTVTHSTN